MGRPGHNKCANDSMADKPYRCLSTSERLALGGGFGAASATFGR